MADCTCQDDARMELVNDNVRVLGNQPNPTCQRQWCAGVPKPALTG